MKCPASHGERSMNLFGSRSHEFLIPNRENMSSRLQPVKVASCLSAPSRYPNNNLQWSRLEINLLDGDLYHAKAQVRGKANVLLVKNLVQERLMNLNPLNPQCQWVLGSKKRKRQNNHREALGRFPRIKETTYER